MLGGDCFCHIPDWYVSPVFSPTYVASFSDRIYLQSPKPVQDVLVSVKGLQLELQRRRGRYPEFFRLIRQRNSYSPEEFERYQLQRLQSVLETAGRTVPYYRRAFAQTGVANTPVTTLSDLVRSALRLRPDVVSEPNAREANQKSAPAVERGLFLVPKVIE